jgi:carbon-monoxide dehydrogenase medium subunit
MKPAPFGYVRADSEAAAIAMLKHYGSGAKLLAGGQSLGPMLNFRIVQPTHLIDIRRIAPLRAIRTTASGGLWIGAGVTHAEIEDGKTGETFLAGIAGGIAYRAVRNRGTIGGSLVQADPAADWPTVMCARGGVAHVLSGGGERCAERCVPLAEFFVDQLQSVLADDELLLGIELPAPGTTRYGFAKIARKPGEFAESLAVVALQQDPQLRIAAISIWLGAAATTPTRVSAAERSLIGTMLDDTLPTAIRNAVGETLPAPQTEVGRYRQQLHAVTIRRAIADALAS